MMKLKFVKLFLILFGIFVTQFASSQNTHFLDSSLIKAYNEIQLLHLDNAKSILDSYKLHSSDPNIYFIENYIDFYTLFIGENQDEYKLRSKHKSERIRKIKKFNQDSPYNRFSRAHILVQWSLINIKFETYFEAFIDIASAYELLNENEKLYPDFKANKMILGVIHALIGTIPESYKWAVKLMGFDGTIQQGNNELMSVLANAHNEDFIFSNEAIVLYTMINLHLKNDQQKAWDIIDQYLFYHHKGPLACFITANVAMRTYQNEKALQILTDYIPNEYSFSFYHLDLMKGVALLRELDPNCRHHLLAYVNNFEGKSYIKEAYLYLAWQDLIFNNGQSYHHWINKSINEGALQTDEDKNAYWESKSGIVPHKLLLKARLLFDGGHWQKAKVLMLNKIDPSSLNQAQTIEYHYRLARIEEESGHYDMAILYFQKVIHEKQKENYLICSAYLHLGHIYEKTNDLSMAKKSYNDCLNINSNRYQTGLHQKAKAGLNRILNK